MLTLQPLEDRRSALLVPAIGALVLAVFAVDLCTPLGLAVWIFYLAPLVLSIHGRSTAVPLAVAVAEKLLSLCRVRLPRTA